MNPIYTSQRVASWKASLGRSKSLKTRLAPIDDLAWLVYLLEHRLQTFSGPTGILLFACFFYELQHARGRRIDGWVGLRQTRSRRHQLDGFRKFNPDLTGRGCITGLAPLYISLLAIFISEISRWGHLQKKVRIKQEMKRRSILASLGLLFSRGRGQGASQGPHHGFQQPDAKNFPDLFCW
ncbi:MAG: hypothetical protein ACPGAP_00325, partial [Akkermansiaceae bacterium]